MKNKGFTLIELLAVIVILAIIALIAVPIILNIVGSSKKSSVVRSGELYLKTVEIAIARKNLNNQFNPKICIIGNDGNLTCDGDKTLTIEVNGSKPTSGTITLEKGKIIQVDGMELDNYILIKNENQKLTLSDKSSNRKIIVAGLLEANNSTVKIYEDGDIHQMYTFEQSATDQTDALTDYRYIGNDPYNYVRFNNEIWRIIGIFPVDDGNGNKEERIKIIRNESIGKLVWNSENINDWNNASLQTYLNGEYYNSLTSESQNMIGISKYYLGGNLESNGVSSFNWYSFERGTAVYNEISTNWIGKIGLMYPSDYGYTYAYGVDNTCFENVYVCRSETASKGWLYSKISEWMITPNSEDSTFAFNTYSQGFIGDGFIVSGAGQVRPTIYLSSNVKIDSGTGKQDDPYILKIS